MDLGSGGGSLCVGLSCARVDEEEEIVRKYREEENFCDSQVVSGHYGSTNTRLRPEPLRYLNVVLPLVLLVTVDSQGVCSTSAVVLA